jgi:hypothetical protein
LHDGPAAKADFVEAAMQLATKPSHWGLVSSRMGLHSKACGLQRAHSTRTIAPQGHSLAACIGTPLGDVDVNILRFSEVVDESVHPKRLVCSGYSVEMNVTSRRGDFIQRADEV